MSLPMAVREWRDDGRFIEHGNNQIFVMDTNSHPGTFLFMLHGFPSSSFDWHLVVPELAKRMRVVTFDFLGFGLSDKPISATRCSNRRTSPRRSQRTAASSGASLVSHDMGDTVAAELLMRQTEGSCGFTIERSILTNGSIFIDMAQLSTGQQFLLSLPDERLPEPLGLDGMRPGLVETFGIEPSDAELDAMVELDPATTAATSSCRARSVTSRNVARTRTASPQGLVSFDGPMTACGAISIRSPSSR